MHRLYMKTFAFFVVIIVFIGICGITLFMYQDSNETADTTLEYSATINEIKLLNTDKHPSVLICTNEFSNAWLITANICSRIDLNLINNLKYNQPIYLRIEKNNADDVNKVNFIDIVALSSENHNIFTLSDYNSYMSNSMFPAQIVGILVIIIITIISFVIFFKAILSKNRNN